MRKLETVLLSWFGLIFFFVSTLPLHGQERPSCGIAAEALGEASRIRGLKVKREVKCRLQSQEEVKAHILRLIAEKMPSGRLELEGAVYEALGFIPDGYAYKEGILEMYLSQIGGYYDPEKKHYVMAAWLPGMMQAPIAVHELTHALQDQHYNLDAMTDMKNFSADELMARMALIEGDATAVMLDYSRKSLGQKSIASDPSVEGVMLQSLIGAAISGAGQKVPPALMAMLIFPYTSGLRFVHGFLKADGYRALKRVFEAPPVSTSQILHPELYGKGGGKLPAIGDDQFEVPADWPGAEIVYRDTLGEFAVSVLLSEFNKDGEANAKIASGWRNDRVIVWKPKEAGMVEVAWRIEWKSAEKSAQFLESYQKGLAGRYPNAKVQKADRDWIELAPGKRLKIIRAPRASTVMVRIKGGE